MREGGQRRLTPADWARAALAAIAEGGVDAVVVETIAGRLGATKGSFYWHFANRDALVEAALSLWVSERTERVIDELERMPDPAERLRVIMTGGLSVGPTEQAEIALLANPRHPAALRAVRHVADRRIGYIADQLRKLGWDRTAALDRAVLAYYMYVGHMEMAHVAPTLVTRQARRRLVDVVFDMVAGGPAVP